MFDVITVGAATRDVFVRSSALDVHESHTPPFAFETCFPTGAKIDIEELLFETGGGATNAAATFARLGFKVAAVCSVGDDSSGRDILDALAKDGISPEFVQKVTGAQTGSSIIVLAGSGERTILVHRGAARKLEAAKISWKDVASRWLYITSLGGDMKILDRTLDHAEKAGIKVAWNPGNAELKLGLAELEPRIRRVDVFNLNREEASLLTGVEVKDLNGIVGTLSGLPKRVLLVTDGPNGAYAAETDGKAWHCDSIEVPRVNTTGAGDAFGSGFVAGLIKKNDIRYGMAVGIWNAVGCIQITGAKNGLLEKFPTEKEIKQVKIEEWK
jgi:sugar/nucleoside kinase (ribokinase family)